MKLLKDYDLIIEYHPRKTNMVANSLIKKTMVALLSLRAKMIMGENGALLIELVVKPTHLSQILEEQRKNVQCERYKQKMSSGKIIYFSVGMDGEIRFKERVFVLVRNDLRKEILRKVCQGPFFMHLGGIKMYRDLKDSYWWLG